MGITFLDQTDEAAGGTPIKFLSRRSMPETSGTLIKFLDSVTEPAAQGVTFVGSKVTNGSPTAPTTVQCALPSGCQAGDVAVLSCSTQYYISLTKDAAWTEVLASTAVGSAPNLCNVAVYLYTLTAADITAGSIDASYAEASGNGGTAAILIDVYRADNGVELDVVGTLTTAASPASPATVTASGVTTTKDGDVLQMSLFVTTFAAAYGITATSGWTVGDMPSTAVAYANIGSAHTSQGTHGVTGDADMSYNYGGTGSPYAILMLALKASPPPVPAITITHTLPTPVQGVAYTGSITATNVDGATGAITLTNTPVLPTGLTLGARTGSGPYTWPITGTPTVDGAFSAEFDATNGTQSASYTWADSVTANPFTLTGTLPNVAPSTTYHGELTLGGYFVAPVTIDASVGTIPSWMTATVSGNTVSFDGTSPATTETDNFTVRATDSTTPTARVATSAQTVKVQVASGPVQMDFVSVGDVSSYTYTPPATPASGHTLLLGISGRCNSVTLPSGWTLVKSASGTARQLVYQKTSDGTESSIAFTCDRSASKLAVQFMEWDGTVTGTPDFDTNELQSSGAISAGPTATPPSATAIPAFFLDIAGQNSSAYTVDSPWTMASGLAVGEAYGALCAWRPAPNAAVTLTGTRPTFNAYASWVNVWIEPN